MNSLQALRDRMIESPGFAERWLAGFLIALALLLAVLVAIGDMDGARAGRAGLEMALAGGMIYGLARSWAWLQQRKR